MLSKITIDLAQEDNQPVILINYQESSDVRDKMVKRFLEEFGGESILAEHTFLTMGTGLIASCNSQIRPIRPLKLEEKTIEALSLLERQACHTPQETIAQITGINYAVLVLRSCEENVSMIITGDTVYWENNKNKTVSQEFSRRELEKLNSLELAKKIISVFDTKWTTRKK